MSAHILEIFSGGESRLDRSSIEKLSDREFEVFEALGEGLSSQRIAKKLHLSAKTVDAHRANIKTKLNIKQTAKLTAYTAHWTSNRASSEYRPRRLDDHYISVVPYQ